MHKLRQFYKLDIGSVSVCMVTLVKYWFPHFSTLVIYYQYSNNIYYIADLTYE